MGNFLLYHSSNSAAGDSGCRRAEFDSPLARRQISISLHSFERLWRCRGPLRVHLVPRTRVAIRTKRAADRTGSQSGTAHVEQIETDRSGKVDDDDKVLSGKQRSSVVWVCGCACVGGGEGVMGVHACAVVHRDLSVRRPEQMSSFCWLWKLKITRGNNLSQMLALIDCAAACGSTE